MPITLEKALASAGYGLVDIAAQELDKRKGWSEPFKNATDVSRAAVCLGSLVVNIAGLEGEVTEALFYSSLPKLEESIYRAASEYVSKVRK